MTRDPDGIPPGCAVLDPPVQITEESRRIRVIVGLPGVAEEQIRIDHREKNLVVTIHDRGTVLKKEIVIPPAERIVKRRFFDGVLEISLEKSRLGSRNEDR
ncbi:MAG TPA: hypothetical protein PK955_08565 [Methanoregulaceae archaeon]|nr:hypothetical protein [Methanoregulaceae archaeon]